MHLRSTFVATTKKDVSFFPCDNPKHCFFFFYVFIFGVHLHWYLQNKVLKCSTEFGRANSFAVILTCQTLAWHAVIVNKYIFSLTWLAPVKKTNIYINSNKSICVHFAWLAFYKDRGCPPPPTPLKNKNKTLLVLCWLLFATALNLNKDRKRHRAAGGRTEKVNRCALDERPAVCLWKAATRVSLSDQN